MMTETFLIGDVHSQADNLERALAHVLNSGGESARVIFLGDLFDSRCATSQSAEVYGIVRSFQDAYGATVLNSNHQDKLRRYLSGSPVRVDLVPELGRTIREFEETNIDRDELLGWLESCPYGYVFNDSSGREYRCAHAYFPSWVEPDGAVVTGEGLPRKARDLMLYGKRDHETKQRVRWWEHESRVPWTRVSGHYHCVHLSERSLVLDGQCGNEGGQLPVYEVNAGRLTYF
jgi:hypothetical protein